MAEKRSQSTLLGFFNQRKKTRSDDTAANENVSESLGDVEELEAPPEEDTTNSENPATFHAVNDIGNFVLNSKRPDDETLYQLLTNH